MANRRRVIAAREICSDSVETGQERLCDTVADGDCNVRFASCSGVDESLATTTKSLTRSEGDNANHDTTTTTCVQLVSVLFRLRGLW